MPCTVLLAALTDVVLPLESKGIIQNCHSPPGTGVHAHWVLQAHRVTDCLQCTLYKALREAERIECNKKGAL